MRISIFYMFLFASLSILPSFLRASGLEPVRNARLETDFLEIVDAFNKEGRKVLPRLARYVSTVPPASLYCDWGLTRACRFDGWDAFSEGDPELLTATRTVLSELLGHEDCFDTAAVFTGLRYLAQKGGKVDLEIMNECTINPYVATNKEVFTYGADVPNKILQTRIAGTNLVGGIFDNKLYPAFFPGARDGYTTNRLSFLPSVANTGPQAEYVYKTYWHAIDLKGGLSSRDTPYSVITNVEPELLTMRVWFDAKGKAVTDTDLSKYGISVPGLVLSSPDPVTNAPPAEPPQEPIPAPPAQTKSPAFPLIVGGVGILAGLLIAVRLWKRR